MDLTNRKPTQMSGVSFGGPYGPNFELFSAILEYKVIALTPQLFSIRYPINFIYICFYVSLS